MRLPWRNAGRSFVVWSHINGLNLGDELVVETVISELKKREPDASIMTVSMFPPGAEKRFGWPSHRIGGRPIDATEWRWLAKLPGPLGGVGRKGQSAFYELTSWLAMVRVMSKYDTLVIAGSGPLEDDPGCAFRLWKWALAARLTGAKVAILSVGAGPLESRMNQRYVKVALRLAHMSSVRDESSVGVLRCAGIDQPVPVRPDQGWAWPPLVQPFTPTPVTGTRVGINVMSLNDPRYDRGIEIGAADYDRFNTYIEKLLRFVEHLASTDHEVVLYSSENHHDVRAASEFLSLLDERGNCDMAKVEAVGTNETSAADVLETVLACDITIATRFHSALIGLALGKPTMALAYHPKTFDLFARMGLDAAIDAESFTTEELIDMFDRVVASPPQSRADALGVVDGLRTELADQFDEAVALGA